MSAGNSELMNPPFPSSPPPAYSSELSKESEFSKIPQQHLDPSATAPQDNCNVPSQPSITAQPPFIPSIRYVPFPDSVAPITSLNELAACKKSCMVICPNCNKTGMTTVEVKFKTAVLILAVLCFFTFFPIIIGFILLLFTFYRAHSCSHCKYEMTRAKIVC